MTHTLSRQIDPSGPARSSLKARSWPCLRLHEVVWLGGVPGMVIERRQDCCTVERADGRVARVVLVEDDDDPTLHIPKVQRIDYLDDTDQIPEPPVEKIAPASGRADRYELYERHGSRTSPRFVRRVD